MRYTLLALAVIALLAASSISNALSIVDCNTLFQNTGPPTYNEYAGILAKYTGYNSTFGIPGFGGLLSIALLIVLAIFSIAGIAYAIGFAFHLQTPMNFARAEFLESFGNLVIIAFIGTSFVFASPAVSFFSNFATFNQGAGASGSNSPAASGSNTVSAATSAAYHNSTTTAASLPSGPTCIASSGYYCSRLNVSGGNVSFVFSQNTGSYLYNLKVACAENSTPAGMPYALQDPFIKYSNGTMAPLAKYYVRSACYGMDGGSYSKSGASIPSGSIWINFTLNSTPASVSNPRFVTKVATFA